nr:hypothetical protein CFP56_21788 [Quercus suber]
MGIQSFLKRIQDAGFGRSSSEIARRGALPQSAILDGPNLAFHVARLLLDKERSVDATIWPSITYAQISSSVIEFLQMLEQYGFEITAVFFDGVLPPAKTDVRINRLQRYVDALSSYHTLHREAGKLAHHDTIAASKLWSTSSLERAKRALPGLPFLVPAIVEGLLSSTYAGITYIVPGEADAFCVAAARKACQAGPDKDVVIFSNDSDLLIYNTGPRSRIVKFSGLGVTDSDLSTEKLMGTEFWPTKIAAAFGKEDLVEVAYHMSRDNSVAVNWVLQLMKEGDYVTDRDFEEFQQAYQIHGETIDLDRLQSDVEARLSLVNLDARVSELVHQVKLWSLESVSGSINVFLPFLLEDPSRKTAWCIGRRTRLAAYNFLEWAYNPSVTVLYEYKRSGTKISAQVITQAEIGRDAVELWLSNLMPLIQDPELSIDGADFDETQRWKFTIIQLTLLDMAHEEMPLPSLQDVMTTLQGQSTREWSLFHISAQYQAAYYSLRMLIQIWRHIENDDTSRLRMWRKQNAKMSVELQKFENFPSISEFFEPSAGSTMEPTRDCPFARVSIKSLDSPELDAYMYIPTPHTWHTYSSVLEIPMRNPRYIGRAKIPAQAPERGNHGHQFAELAVPIMHTPTCV